MSRLTEIDIGWLCISRFILLDSMLLFFTFTTTLGLVKFHSQRHDPFGEDWWIWLVFTGWSIGCVCSVKWVGMFVTAMVGVYTVEDLWEQFGDLRMPVVSHTCSLASVVDQERMTGGSDLEHGKSQLKRTAHIHQTLDGPYLGPHCAPIHRLRRLLQDPLPRAQSLRTRRRPNVFPVPSASEGERLRRITPRNRLRLETHIEELRIRRWSITLSRPNSTYRIPTTANHLLPLQGRQQPLGDHSTMDGTSHRPRRAYSILAQRGLYPIGPFVYG